MTADDAFITLSIQIPRSLLIPHAAPPDLLSQKNVSAVCGIPARRYLELLRSAPLAVTKLGRLRLVDRLASVELIRSRGVAPTAPTGPCVAPTIGPGRADPVEVLAGKLGGEVSQELAAAAVNEAREMNSRLAELARSLGLVEVEKNTLTST